ncbi:MAG: DUF222 domain-containing protein [Vicinamibacterales bacterium]|jgi:hypothetical protein|nr:DUF222 domain-containing protein [Vicinamibacterales bacterium]MDP6609951.1 DUF222 domain-containing protein [Vicinamibacterales bacterium]HAK54803.1 hypothetical protein [Acidobacteriota bacterium]|tara:strand:+ start:8044 stop:9504 length:1461 start_codon:yes stop_codon:yes gene_type:complete
MALESFRSTAPTAAPAAPRPASHAERLGESIAELAARIQAATYELLVLIRKFDDCSGWNNGFRSCAHWLNWRTGLDLGAAREKVRVARALADLPLLGAAMQRGELSYSKVRALTRVATPENESTLLDFARCGTASHVERLVRGWRRVDRVAEATDDRRRHESRHLETWVDDDGMVVIRGRLSPETGAVVRAALEAAADRLYHDERTARAAEEHQGANTSAGQRRADALGLVAESALAGDLDPGTATDRYQVVVHVDESVLHEHGAAEAARPSRDVSAETSRHVSCAARGQAALEGMEGLRVSAETSRRLACDASKVVMRHGAHSAPRAGRKTRTVSPALRRALTSRDPRCRFPGCGARHCDAHHVRHWADGGATRLDNLVRLCRRHHRAVHEEGFTVALRGDGAARFHWPDGRPLPDAPPPPPWSLRSTGPPLGPTLDGLDAAGIAIDPRAGKPHWHGERLDETWAIDALWRPRATGEDLAAAKNC